MNIEVWSDIGCPFCYIADTRLKKAIAAMHRTARTNLTVIPASCVRPGDRLPASFSHTAQQDEKCGGERHIEPPGADIAAKEGGKERTRHA